MKGGYSVQPMSGYNAHMTQNTENNMETDRGKKLVDKELIIENVRDRYGELARGAADCCGDRDGFAPGSVVYDSDQIKDLPEEALIASAGCGNPNAIGELKQGETVVDLGSGGGIDCFIAANMVGETGRVIGVDMTPDMINLANENKVRVGAGNVEFRLAQIDKTGIGTDSVDVIISNCVIVLAPDKDAVFRESVRILRRGGRMHISDLMLTDELPGYVSSDIDNWTHCLAGAELINVYINRMRESGFSKVEITSNVPYRGGSEEDWVSSIRSVNLLATN